MNTFISIFLAALPLAAQTIPNYVVQLQSLATGNCIQSVGNTRGSLVELYPCAGLPSQLWLLTEQSDGTYVISSSFSSAYGISTPGNSSVNSVHLQISDTTATGSHWSLNAAQTDGYFRLSRGIECVDNTGGYKTAGTPVQQWQCTTGNRNQQWRFVTPPYPTQAASYDPAAQTPSSSFSAGNTANATVTWYHDPGLTLPAYGAMEGQMFFGLLSQPATASAYGSLADGVLTQQDSTHIQFHANSSIVPCHDIQGLQPLPCDTIFFTRVDNLPWLSSHSVGDGSGYCEDGKAYDKLCQGDPYLGTGWYAAVGPVNSSCITSPGGTVYKGNPGTYLGGGNPSGVNWQANYDCHVVFPASGINFGPTTWTTVLDGTEPITLTANPVYASYSGPFPNAQFRFNELRESGMMVNPSVNCNSTGNTAANPAFLNCKPGGTQPYYLSAGGIDAHEIMISPKLADTWEIYNDERFGALAPCQNGSITCTIGSGRHINWHTYAMPSNAIGAAGTPESQLQLSVMDLARAAADPVKYPISHVFSFTEPGFSFARSAPNPYVWPADYYSGYISYNANGVREGYRKRLDPARASIQNGLYAVTALSLGSGYTPGSVVQGVVGGCQSIDGVHPAVINAFIGANGSVVKNPSGGQVFMYIANTGMNCVVPMVTFPPPPSGGTTITASLAVFSLTNYSQAEQNLIQALYNQATQYGGEVDDIGSASNETFRTDGNLNMPQFAAYRKAVSDFYGSASNGFGDGVLWGWVDTSSLVPSGGSWPSGMAAKSWVTDATGSAEGSSVPHQNLLQLTNTATGTTSLSPIPVLGVAVGFQMANLANVYTTVAGMAPVNLAQYAYVTGDPSNAGTTFSWIIDPCPGLDSLTASGTYTACSSVSGLKPVTGQIMVLSSANPAAFTYVWLTVLPGFNNGMLSIDTGGSGGCVNGATYTSATPCVGAGTTWTADCAACYYQTFPSGAQWDYPHWPWSTWGGAAAPQSVSGESTIYQTYLYGNPDLTFSLVVPNGNYTIRLVGVGSHNRGGNSNTQTSVLIPYYNSSVTYSAQGQFNRWAFCPYCQVNYQSEEPVDVTLTARVTDNILKIGAYGYSPSRWLGWDRVAKGGNPAYTFLSGVQIAQDSTTQPHWEIGSYVPGMSGGAQYNGINGVGDNFTIPLWNSVPYSPLGAPQPGVLQLYIRDVFTGLADPVWTLSGAGSITPAGLFTAPTMPSDCSTVTATSASRPTISASQTICFTGSIPATRSARIQKR